MNRAETIKQIEDRLKYQFHLLSEDTKKALWQMLRELKTKGSGKTA